MGYNSNNANTLVLDIETGPLPDAALYFEPVEAPANYKSEAAITKYLDDARAKQLKKAALNVDLAQVLAIGYSSDGAAPTVLTQQEVGEAAILSAFWQLVQSGTRFIGFNILRFDLPMLLRRSLYLRVPTPLVEVHRRNPRICDLMQVLSWDGLLDTHSLAFYLSRFGIAQEDPVKGSDIPALAEAGDWTAIAAHCYSDVKLTTQLAQRMGLLAGALPVAVTEGF